MNRKDKISVIVPVYNVEAYLEESVDSILAQDWPDFEVILVDDGSTDGSLAICRRYEVRDPRVKVLTQPNAGLSAARNTGLKAASGKWVTFVDSDDMISPCFLSRMMNVKGDADVAMCGFDMFFDTDAPTNYKKGKPFRLSGERATELMLYQNSSGRGVNSSACAKIFNAKLFDNRAFLPGIFYEDLQLTPVLISDVMEVVAIPDRLYRYRLRRGSITNDFTPKRLDVLDVTDRIVEHFSSNQRLRRAARDRRLSAAFNMLMLMGANSYSDAAAIARCRDIVKRQRFDSLINPRVRLKNKGGIILSYIFGIGIFYKRFFASRL